MPKTGRSVPTPANDHKSLMGMKLASGIAGNPRPSKTVPKESRPLRLVQKVETVPEGDGSESRVGGWEGVGGLISGRLLGVAEVLQLEPQYGFDINDDNRIGPIVT